jgi:AcrR family transcriptional regulator
MLYRVKNFVRYSFLVSGERGLRERKKQATRQRISDVATMLFAQRGFDAVTVAEVAEAANVSKMTVFNYFPRKEELIFDRGAEAEELLRTALRDRPPGQPVVTTLHALLVGLIEAGHPLGGVGDGFAAFWRIVLDSAALRTAVLNSAEQQEKSLALLLRQTVEPRPGDPPAELVAAMMIALYRTVFRRGINATMTGRSAAEARPEVIAAADEAFRLLTAALGDYGAR